MSISNGGLRCLRSQSIYRVLHYEHLLPIYCLIFCILYLLPSQGNSAELRRFPTPPCLQLRVVLAATAAPLASRDLSLTTSSQIALHSHSFPVVAS